MEEILSHVEHAHGLRRLSHQGLIVETEKLTLDVILMDLVIPQVDGIQVTQRITSERPAGGSSC